MSNTQAFRGCNFLRRAYRLESSFRTLSVPAKDDKYRLRDEDYQDYFTDVTRSRQPSATRSLIPFLSVEGMISLGLLALTMF